MGFENLPLNLKMRSLLHILGLMPSKTSNISIATNLIFVWRIETGHLFRGVLQNWIFYSCTNMQIPLIQSVYFIIQGTATTHPN